MDPLGQSKAHPVNEAAMVLFEEAQNTHMNTFSKEKYMNHKKLTTQS